MNQNDLRVIRSKKLIQEAFFELMEEKGYQNLTIKDISERAMINRKTFYHHYESIDLLFADIIKSTIALLFEGLLSVDSDGHLKTKEELRDDIQIFLHNVNKHKRLINIFLHDVSNYELTKQLGERLLQSFFNKTVVSNRSSKSIKIPADLLSRTITSIFITVMVWYMENSDTYSEEDTTEIFLELIPARLFRFQ